MDFNSALNRIIWRFQNCDNIIVNEKDIQAVNLVVEYINHQGNQTFQSNIHFAKLYTYTLGQYLEKYDTTIDNPIVHRELHRLLDSPFKKITMDIAEYMNNKHRYYYLKLAGCRMNIHPLQATKAERDSTALKLNTLLTPKKKLQQFLNGPWSSEEIESGLTIQIKNFLYGIQKSK